MIFLVVEADSTSIRPISDAPRKGLVILHFKDGTIDCCYYTPVFFGWASYHEDVPLIRHERDILGWSPADEEVERLKPMRRVGRKRTHRKPMLVIR